MHRTRTIPWLTALLAAVAVAVWTLPGAPAAAEFDRTSVAAGEGWRIVTGHWAHFSNGHLAWSLLAFVVLGALCERRSRSRFLACTAAAAVVVALAVWAFEPSLHTYRGLSGIDSGLFVLLAVSMLREHLRDRGEGWRMWSATAAAALVAFVVKVAVELATGAAVFVDAPAGGFVSVPLAHAAGAVVGAVAGVIGAPRPAGAAAGARGAVVAGVSP